MAAKSTSKKAPPRPLPRLYVTTPKTGDANDIARALAGIVGAADIAAVLIEDTASDERGLINAAKAVGDIVQPHGIALLLRGHAALAARAGADGCHIDGVAALREHLDILHPDRIAGAGQLVSRHDAMEAGEAGADYVLFGEPNAQGKTLPRTALIETIGWWAEVFELPCVAYARDLDDVAPLVTAGADFIMLGDALWSDPRGAKVALAQAAGAIADAHAKALQAEMGASA